jgi:hypothetical protein
MDFAPTRQPIILIRGDSARPLKRWTSWYDSNLVTRAGEDILAHHDDWGVEFLRRNRLVWNSWGQGTPPALDDDVGYWRHRIIGDVEIARLRMFAISLLWRAAASTLPEFAAIQIPPDHLEKLRIALLTGSPPEEKFYPSTFTLFSTKGDDHIWAPEALNIPEYNDNGTQIGEIPIFRFFMNGFNILFKNSGDYAGWTGKGLGVNDDGNLVIQTFPFENSRQMLNMEANHKEAIKAFPAEMKRYGVEDPPNS